MLLRIAAVAVVTTVGFLLLQQPARQLEGRAAAAALRLAGAEGVHFDGGTSILVVPDQHAAFRAVVTPPCSSLSSILAIGCLASLGVRLPRSRRLFALSTALTTVAVGNVVRIAGSVAVGLAAGRASLVLFHDWVGSVFAFGYTIGGYVLLLCCLLPSHSSNRRALRVAHT